MSGVDPLGQPGLDEELSAELARFEENVRRAGSPLLRWMRPGLSVAQFTAATAGIFDPAPAEVLTWFAWHDGTDPNGAYEALLPNREWVPGLAEAMQDREQLLQMNGPQQDELPSMTFQPTWLPLIGYGTHYLVADLTPGPGPHVPIHDVSFASDPDWDQPQEPSITSMVRAWNTHLENGNYHWDKTNNEWADIRFYDPQHWAVT